MPRRNWPPGVLGGEIPVCLGGLARQTKGTVLHLGAIGHLGFWEGRSRKQVTFVSAANTADKRYRFAPRRNWPPAVLGEAIPQTGNFCLGA